MKIPCFQSEERRVIADIALSPAIIAGATPSPKRGSHRKIITVG